MTALPTRGSHDSLACPSTPQLHVRDNVDTPALSGVLLQLCLVTCSFSLMPDFKRLITNVPGARVLKTCKVAMQSKPQPNPEG